MEMISHSPKLNVANKTFPKLYYKFKHLEKNNKEKLPIIFLELLGNN